VQDLTAQVEKRTRCIEDLDAKLRQAQAQLEAERNQSSQQQK
jgi:hypothetical protein